MTIQEIDFQLIENKAANKVFKFTNADGSIYDMTASTAACKLYLDPGSPTNIVCTIDVPNGKITIPFTTTHSATIGTSEYILEENVGGGGTILPLVKGNIMVVPYTPFSQSIEAYLNSELPANLTISMDYRNQRITYWRKILQSAFNISDVNLHIESSWPDLVNALFAKLVVYDALELATRGSFIQFLGGDYTDVTEIGGGGVKSVETGPTKVEYYDTSTSVKNAFSASPGSMSAFDVLRSSVCGLADHLRVKLPMCPSFMVPIKPQYHQNAAWGGTPLPDL